MNKKGITFNYLIAGIIAIIVLITLIWVFRDSLRAAMEPWFNVIKGVTAGGEEIGKELENLA